MAIDRTGADAPAFRLLSDEKVRRIHDAALRIKAAHLGLDASEHGSAAPSFDGTMEIAITAHETVGEIVLNAKEVTVHAGAVTTAEGDHSWQMEFFSGRSLATLRPLFKGPMRMKDIRVCPLADGRVGVFTRPQGVKGGRGKIGFTIAESLAAITTEMIEDAPVLPGQFASGEWGGANEAHLLEDGTLGVLGHIACWDQRGNRHYYPMSFILNPHTLACGPIEIIARRSAFPDGPSKRTDLFDVVFSGGMVRHHDGTATIYAGLSDAAAGTLRIADPFVPSAVFA